MSEREIVLACPLRTPIGKFGGALSPLSAVELGTQVVKKVLEQSQISADRVDGLIFGNARQAGNGVNPARQILYQSGIPETIPAHTVNMACASGLQAIVSACQVIRGGDANLIVVGGTESMSRVPFMAEPELRWGYRLGHHTLLDGMYRDGLRCSLSGLIMGETAENLARRYEISREEQDEYAYMSQSRCQEARASGRFASEIVPIEFESKNGQTRVEVDEHPRDNITTEGLKKLRPVFAEDGTVTAGNSSGIVDGAAALIVTTREKAEKLGVTPLARIAGYAATGCDPTIMGIGPVSAIQALQERTGVSLHDIDLIELNEAFAVQVLACHRELSFDLEKLNVNGGAIALGHPIGCTGTRIVVTLLNELQRRDDARLGLATLCVSGGMGMAMLVERC